MNEEIKKIIKDASEMVEYCIYIYATITSLKYLEYNKIESGSTYKSLISKLKIFSIKERNIVRKIDCYSGDLSMVKEVILDALPYHLKRAEYPFIFEVDENGKRKEVMLPVILDPEEIAMRFTNIIDNRLEELATDESAEILISN